MVHVRRLIWERWNVAHIARHNVSPDEAEEVCHGDPLVLQTYAGRLLLIGRTNTGRMLAVVLGPQGRSVFYPVTARPASRRERALYQQSKKGDSE